MGLSQRAYALHRKRLGLPGGTLRAVQKAIESGRITLQADSTIDPVVADQQWRENTLEMKQRDAQPVSTASAESVPAAAALAPPVNPPASVRVEQQQPPLDLAEPTKTDLEKLVLNEKIEALRRENERRSGDLIPAAEVEQEVGELIVESQNRLLLMASEVSERLAATSDLATVRSILTDHIRHAMEGLSRYRVQASTAAAVALVIVKLASMWEPPSRISVSEWAEQHRHISSEVSARGGQWRSFSFQREPMDSMSNPAIRRVVIKSATQILKSSTAENTIGYAMDVTPGPIMVLLPRKEDAIEFSEDRLAPMIEASPRLRAIATVTRSGRAPKRFKGGRLTVTSGGSPANVAKRAIMLLVVDEADKLPYSAGEEGGPVALARKRGASYLDRFKELIASSPTIEGSLIDREYALSDQREFFIPCPHCGTEQSLMKKWHRVRWEKTRLNAEGTLVPLTRQEQADSARYYCEAEGCQKPWDNRQLKEAVEHGRWIAQAPFNGIAGYWISELYSPFKSLPQIVMDFFEKKDHPEDYKAFVNTSLAENWVAQGEAPQYELLLARRENYSIGIIPAGGLIVTAGVDVQEDRLEVGLRAWGRRLENWSFLYEVLEGDTSELSSSTDKPTPWERLTALLAEHYPHERGSHLPVSLVMVDSGYRTNTVYNWVRLGQPVAVMATKGVEKGHRPVGLPTAVDVTIGGRIIKSGMKVRTINTSFFKEELYSWLKKAPPSTAERTAGLPYPAGYCHFPLDERRHGEEFMKQLCAEQLVSIKDKRRGYVRQEWQKIRPRNEVLDVYVLERAAAWELGVDRAREEHWKELESQLGPQQRDFELSLLPALSQTSAPPGAAERPAARTVPAPPPVTSRWVPRRQWFGEARA